MQGKLEPGSWLVSAGREDREGAPLNVPLIPASNFIRGGRHNYSRGDGTATWEALEEVIGGLEGGRSVAFASGMAAVAAVFDLLPVGATVAVPEDCYNGVVALALAGEDKGRWSVCRLPVGDTGAWVDACGEADLIWLESASNPLLEVPDLEVIAAAPRRADAILAVDSTFASPLNQRPLELGASLAVLSATKLIGGHSDLLSGVVTAGDEALWQSIRSAREHAGATPGALEAFLAVRGARTLALRLQRAQSNAGRLAELLEAHPAVSRVRYPGLASHPSHEVASRVLRGFGTVLAFEVLGGAEAADAVCRRVRLIRHATSLGSVESTMERRASYEGQEHVPPSLLRLSVGIEDPGDLWADLEATLVG